MPSTCAASRSRRSQTRDGRFRNTLSRYSKILVAFLGNFGLNYAFTREEGALNGAKLLVRLGVTTVGKSKDMEQAPLGTAWTWSWEISENGRPQTGLKALGQGEVLSPDANQVK